MSLSFVGSSLIKLYARSGYNNNAWFMFDKMSPKKNRAMWNVVLNGLLLYNYF